MMRGWLKTGRRRPAELEEAPEAPPVDEQSAEPIERPLVVLLPGMGSFLSFELHSFSDARSALELLEARSIKDVREVNAFWTLQGPPPARADSPSEAEVLVLTRDSDRPQMVHLISFTDIDAAYAFIRAEVNEGLPLESVLVYWSLPIAIKRDRIGVITMSPSVCPSFDQIAEERTQSPVFETVEAPIRDEAAALAEAEPQTPDEEPKRWRDWLPAPAPSLQPLFPPALSGTIGLDFEEPAAEVAEPEVAEPEVHPVADGQLMPGDLDELMRSLTEEAAERLPLTADENKRLVEAELGLLPLSEPDTMSKEEPQEAAPEAKLWPEPGVEAGLGLGAPPDDPEAAEPEPIAQAFPEPELIPEVVPEPLAEVAPEMPTPVEDIAEPPLRDVEVLDEKPQVSQPEPRLWPESMVEMAAPPAEPKGAEPEPTTEVPPEQDPVPEI
ncbi:MAG TPA: hypothetical protein VFB90_04895, partial [Dehalococcoidia bacterium]|nr:hypothetical protein [Dehalococcoidia bacterium]